jgi:hypothetical protein
MGARDRLDNSILPSDIDKVSVLPASRVSFDGRWSGAWLEVSVWRARIEDTLEADVLWRIPRGTRVKRGEFYQVCASDEPGFAGHTLGSFRSRDKALGAARDLCARTGARLIDMTGGI